MRHSSREAAVRGITKHHLLLTPDGRFVPAEEVDAADLEPVQARLLGLPAPGQRHTGKDLDGLLRALRLGAAERAADKGHFRYYPAGVLVRRLLREWLERYIRDATGGVEIVTPAIFRWDEEQTALLELAGSFDELLYHLAGGAEETPQAILRYGGDPGFFALLRDTRLAPDQFPYHVYELVEGFRRHRTGEVSGILRARSFTFFDHHALCVVGRQGVEEFLRMLTEQKKFLDGTGRHHHLQLIVVAEAVTRLREPLLAAARGLGMPVHLTVLSDPKHYYTMVTNFCDPRGRHILQIQFDEQNARRFGLAGCPERYPEMVVLHMSSGALERWLASFLEDGLDSPRRAALPLWLAPVQVRVLPHRAEQTQACRLVRERLEQAGVRADLDDRPRSLTQRLAAAEREWVPLVAVVGARELKSDTLDVRDRAADTRASMTADALLARFEERTAGYPRHPVLERTVAGRASFLG